MQGLCSTASTIAEGLSKSLRIRLVLQASPDGCSAIARRNILPGAEEQHVGAGRVDDVINVSGHRIGTAEVEGALTTCHLCTEAAVVPMEHPIKGQGIYAFVSLMEVPSPFFPDVSAPPGPCCTSSQQS